MAGLLKRLENAQERPLIMSTDEELSTLLGGSFGFFGRIPRTLLAQIPFLTKRTGESSHRAYRIFLRNIRTKRNIQRSTQLSLLSGLTKGH